MKLIDLLVQELPNRGGWPEGAYFIACDSDGTVDSYRNEPEKDDTGLNWRDSEGLGYFTNLFIDLAIDWESAIITREQYGAALAASKQASWDGEGLPPIGCICEALAPSRKGSPWSWQRVKVVEAGIDGAEKECLVYNIETTRPSWADEFRPIRTEAERKCDEAKDAIAELCRSSASNGHSADLIYDAIADGKIPGIKMED